VKGEPKVRLKVEHNGKTIFEREGYLLYDSEKRYRVKPNKALIIRLG
jgi:hypothetical protein